MEPHPLSHLGWDDGWTASFAPQAEAGLEAGRAVVAHRGAVIVQTVGGEIPAEPSGRLRHDADAGGDMPVVGDWVAVHRPPHGRAVVDAVLPRRTRLSRKDPHLPREQVVAANVDVVFCVESAAGGVNERRLQRYVAMAWASGAEPVVLLTKADVCDDPDEAVAAAGGVGATSVLLTSVVTGQGVSLVTEHVPPARTAVLVGPSGVGKSSLVNALCGDTRQAIADIRADGRGRHTTTRRELISLPGGGLLIDTPGLREIALWEAGDGLDSSFADVVAIAGECRFGDCSHEREPGCAIAAAIAEGRLPAERLAEYRKLQREAAFLERQQNPLAQKEERRRWKQITKAHRRNKKL